MDQEKNSRAIAAHQPGIKVDEWSFPLRKLGDHDVEIKITHSGICHSDLHTIMGHWGSQTYPCVPGHEIVGFVTATGKNVTRFKVGTRVGVGPQALSCFDCKYCKRGDEIYCPGRVFTYGARHQDGYITKGGYAEFHRVHENFAFAIPKEIASEHAAPLLCAGITVYSPMRFWKIGKGSRVGVIGVGGLGHLAVQFANKLGATVTAISSRKPVQQEPGKQSPEEFVKAFKKEYGENVEVLSPTELDPFTFSRAFDFFINTGSSSQDFSDYFLMLDIGGTFINLGGNQGDIKVDASHLNFHRQNITGSLVGSPLEIEEMLRFAADNKVFPTIERVEFNSDAITNALDRVQNMKVKYRAVIYVDPNFKP